jgi:hypothetical protein
MTGLRSAPVAVDPVHLTDVMSSVREIERAVSNSSKYVAAFMTTLAAASKAAWWLWLETPAGPEWVPVSRRA